MFTLRLLKIKIHSRRVFVFKRCLPIFAFLLAGTMIVWPALVEHKEKFSSTLPTSSLKNADTDMENVRFFSKDSKKNPMTVVASVVQEIDTERKIAKLFDPVATYRTQDNVLVTLLSSYGLVFQNEKYLFFEDVVNTSTDNGYEAVSKKIVYNYDKNTITGDEPIYIKGPAGMLVADAFSYQHKTQELDFKGKTKTVIFAEEKSQDKIPSLTFDLQDKYYVENRENVKITSEDGLKINQMNSSISAFKNAHVYQDKMHLKGEKIVLYYTKVNGKTEVERVEAFTSVQAVQNATQQAQAEKMFLYRNIDEVSKQIQALNSRVSHFKVEVPHQLVVMEDDALMKEGVQVVSADKMFVLYQDVQGKNNSEIDKVVALGHVAASNGTQIIAGDFGLYNPKTGKVDIYENVRLKQGNSVLAGDYAHLNLNTGISSISSPQTGSTKRVKGSFIPAEFENESEAK